MPYGMFCLHEILNKYIVKQKSLFSSQSIFVSKEKIVFLKGRTRKVLLRNLQSFQSLLT